MRRTSRRIRGAITFVLALGCVAAIADEPPALLPGMDAPAAQSALHDAGTATARSDNPDVQTEVITERYPNGAVKVRREVTQDIHENFVNHGGYELYDQSGKLIMSGRFDMGKMIGLWSRTLSLNEINLGADAVDRQFRGPFVSSAEFKDGELNGAWTIFDPSNHKVIEWTFRSGRPHGTWTWYYANGCKKKQAEYDDGTIKGIVTEWSPDGRVTAETEYVDGRRRVPKITYHPGSKQKKSEGSYLVAHDNSLITHDWWNCKVKVESLGKAGPDVRDGLWTFWHANGQVQMTGEFRAGTPVGTFTWWYANGQKQAEGEYLDGQQHGRWTTWYANGLKQSQGDYDRGTPTGKWRTWNEDGRVAEAQEFHPGGEETVITEEIPSGKGKGAPSRSSQAPASSTRRTRMPSATRN